MKYTRILFYLLALSVTTSCDKKYISNIPEYPVYLELDLSFEDKDLVGPQSCKIFTNSNINQAVEKAGFGGVIVYHGLNNSGASSFYAFDLACPYEANRSTLLEVDDTKIYAVCTKCNSKFEMLNGIGNPVSGPSQTEGWYLKSYTVIESGNRIIIRN